MGKVTKLENNEFIWVHDYVTRRIKLLTDSIALYDSQFRRIKILNLRQLQIKCRQAEIKTY